MDRKGIGSIAGLLATFAASALLITIAMLFVTGVAQRGILPRLKQRAAQAVPPPAPASVAEAADSLIAGATGAADSSLAPVAVDSLRALRSQVQFEQERLAAENTALEETIGEYRSAREESEAEADRRLAALAKIYGNMKPEAAARVLARLDDPTFERVIGRIEKRQAAKILSLIDPDRVARLTLRAATGGGESSQVAATGKEAT